MIEFALILLPLAVLIFGIVDIGRSYEIGNRLSNAAREAGAVLTYSPIHFSCTDGTSAKERARDEDKSLGTDSSYKGIVVKLTHLNVTTTIYDESAAAPLGGPSCDTYSGSAPVTGDTLTITASYSFSLITPLIGRITGSPIDMTRTVSVRVQ